MIITRTWRLEDDCGNVLLQDQIITVLDTLEPIFPKPADVTLETENGALCPGLFIMSIVADQMNPVATGNEAWTFEVHGVTINGPTVYSDNCSQPQNLSLYLWTVQENFDGAADDCYRQIRLVWRVYDDCGNYQARQQFFTVIDNTAPTFTAPADITIFTDENCDFNAAPGITGDVTDEEDNCILDLDASYTDMILPGNCEGEFVITRTWTLEDDCGNAALPQDQIITVKDNTDPTFTVPADVTIYKDVNCDHDADISITGDVTDEADNCTTILDATFADTVDAGSCEGELVISRTWTLVDDCGNENVQVQTITVLDTLKPIFPKPADLTLSTEDGATCPAIADISLTINQNDPVATGNEPFTYFVHGIEINGPEVYSDNCSSPENLSLYIWNIEEDFDGMAGNCYRQIRVIFRVYDDCGNFQQRQQLFTILEETPPVALCKDVTIYLDEFGEVILQPSDVDNGSSDNCDPDPLLTVNAGLFTCADVGDHMVVLTIEDFCGFTDQCDAIVTVLDTVAPEALCKNAIVFLDANGMASITVGDIDNGSNDACGLASLELSRTEFFCSDLGDVLVTLTVTDVNGNVAECTAFVTVDDIIPPVAVCKDIMVSLNGQGEVYLLAYMIDGGSTDNCNVGDAYVIPDTLTCDDIGANFVTLVVSDIAGNTSTCTSSVVVKDDSSPTASCKNITLILNANGDPIVIQPADIDNNSFDNCGFASIEISKSVFTCSDWGPNVVKLILTDPSGNVSECSAIVTIVDNMPPVWTFLPGDVTVYCVENGANEVPLAEDNCDLVQVTLKSADQEVWPAGPPNSYLVRRIWMALDGAGNTVFYEQIVYVLPGGELFVNCNQDIVTPETNIPIKVTWPIPFVDDICAGKEDMYQIGGPLPGSYFNPGSKTIITYEYIDTYGTRWQCAFWVTVPNDSSDYALILNEQDCHNLVLEDCQLSDLPSPDNYSFEYIIINQVPIRFNLESVAELETYADGSARLRGQWVDGSGLCGWDMDIWLHRRRTHDGWVNAGGKINNLVPGANPELWDFFEVDGTLSTMTGFGCYAGQEYQVTISPNFSKFGFQYGVGANTKTLAHGGWVIIGIRNPNTEQLLAQGIFSFELDCQFTGFTLKDAAEVVSLDGFDYPVVWSNGVSGPELGDVPAGNYSVTITDQNGKDSVATFVLIQPTDCEGYFENACRPGNVATDGQAKQVSTFQGAVASRAIDGNTDGNAANNSVSGTLAGFQNWWSLDMILPQDVHKIRIWNRTDCCSDWLQPIWVFVSEYEIPEFGIPEEIAQIPWITAFYHDGPIDTFAEFDFQGKAQRVKIQLGEYGRLMMAEVQVLVCQPDQVGIKTDDFAGDGTGEEAEVSRVSPDDQVPVVSTWPNPASDVLDLEVRQEKAFPVTISVMNLQGKEMYRTQLPADQLHRVRVDVGTWAPGLYFLTTTSPAGATSQPVTIQR
ncbi:MAG: T9SS type A sorting domain-containing protein [Saprospiraceae bacterium]|nr:T9SS type A sorting domain-containing protein [Saprospiraceae bacterium]